MTSFSDRLAAVTALDARPNGPSMGFRGAALTAAAAGLAAWAMWLSGLLLPLEQGLQTTFFRSHFSAASQQVVIVEMDAASLAAIRRWPWDRRHYAELVDRLDAAGARSIAFDVDFSMRSTASADRLLAQSFDRASSQLVLPTFSQRESHEATRVLDTLPLEEFRSSATLASVSVVPDADGQVRRMPLGTVTADIPRPSLSAQIAQRNGTAGQNFPLDRSIRTSTIPRLSFIAIERGEFDPAEVAGKDLLVGATAVEMGDRYSVPGYGVIPGVLIQALATETLLAGVPAEAGGGAALVLGIGLSVWIVRARRKGTAVARFAVSAAFLAIMLALGWSVLRILIAIAPALTAISATVIVRLLAIIRNEQDYRRTHDAQTGLPNRLAMTRSMDAGEFLIVVAIGNLERLRAVLGFASSGELICKIAERIIATTGCSAVYQVEEKYLAWSHAAVGVQPDVIVPQVATILRQPVEVAGRHVDVQIAFGVAAAGDVSEATLAASEALKSGELLHYHADAEKTALDQQISLMGELDAAIALHQLEVAYQPKLRLSSNTIDAVEALVRWNHPERGYLRPDIFIPLAESADRIDDLTLYVLKRTIEDLGEWCSDGLIMHAAVNISARLLSDARFLAAVEALLEGTGVPKSRLIFEVTESAAFLDADAAIKALQRFHEMGVTISMDDYGTGQSTLSYLKRLPLSELKIDRSFVQFAHCDRGDALLVRSTLNLAHELGLQVVAEGVEDIECLEFLRGIGCDYAQGYLIGKPMAADKLARIAGSDFKLAA